MAIAVAFLGGWSHLQLKAFWGWCCLVSLQHPGIWTTPFSQMDWPDDDWSGKSSHFLSSILPSPSPSPSPLPSHPTISGSLLGILCLIRLVCFRRAFPINVAYFRSRISCQWFNKGLFLDNSKCWFCSLVQDSMRWHGYTCSVIKRAKLSLREEVIISQCVHKLA